LGSRMFQHLLPKQFTRIARKDQDG
jgi:hypothetical protein